MYIRRIWSGRRLARKELFFGKMAIYYKEEKEKPVKMRFHKHTQTQPTKRRNKIRLQKHKKKKRKKKKISQIIGMWYEKV